MWDDAGIRFIAVAGERVVTANAVLLLGLFFLHRLVAVHTRNQGDGFEVAIDGVQFNFANGFVSEKGQDICVERWGDSDCLCEGGLTFALESCRHGGSEAPSSLAAKFLYYFVPLIDNDKELIALIESVLKGDKVPMATSLCQIGSRACKSKEPIENKARRGPQGNNPGRTRKGNRR